MVRKVPGLRGDRLRLQAQTPWEAEREFANYFAHGVGATLEVMPGGEHKFHTPEQMAFRDGWIRRTVFLCYICAET